MMRILNILILVVCFASNAIGQIDKIAEALFALQNKNLDEAKMHIDVAVTDPNLGEQAKTWYWRGIIYKELFKSASASGSTQIDQANPLRMESIYSFKKCIKLDSVQFLEQSLSAVKYLSATLFNDAADNLINFNFDNSVKLFQDYVNVSKDITSEKELISKEIEFYNFYGMKMSEALEDSARQVATKASIEKSANAYRHVLELDSLNQNGNYNLGILYYNDAVQKINSLNFNDDIFVIYETQEISIGLFKQALPYMLRARRIDPSRPEVLEGLSGIYFSINEMDNSDFYKELLNYTNSLNGRPRAELEVEFEKLKNEGAAQQKLELVQDLIGKLQ